MNRSNPCPVCGSVMEGHIQPGHGYGPDRWEEHCVRRSCKLFMVTLSEGEHAALSPEQIEAYGVMNMRQQEREVRYG